MNKLLGCIREVDAGRVRNPISYLPRLLIGAIIGAIFLIDAQSLRFEGSNVLRQVAVVFGLVAFAVIYVFADLLGRALWLKTKLWYRARENPLLQYTHAARVGALKIKSNNPR